MEVNSNETSHRNGRRIPVRRPAGRPQEEQLGASSTELPDVAGQGSSQRAPDAVVSSDEVARPDVSEIDWRDTALRLRAEMENYRKRQERWAEAQTLREKAKLLVSLLEVVDLVESAVQHAPASQDSVLAMIHAALMKVLQSEGVEPVLAQETAFDPDCHEAVALVPPLAGQRAPLWVVAEERRGYRLGDTLLRAARVVVAGEK